MRGLPPQSFCLLFLALGSSRGHLKVTGGSGPAFVPLARAGDCAGLRGSGQLRHAWGERATVEETGVPGRPQGPLLAAAATQPGPAETPRLAPPRGGHTRSPGPVPGSPPGSRGDPRSGQRHRATGPRPGEGIPAPGAGNGRLGVVSSVERGA